jgi:hypothetical protein
VGIVEENIKEGPPTVKDCGVHDIGAVGSRAKGGFMKLPTSLEKLIVRGVACTSGKSEGALDMIVAVLQQNVRRMRLVCDFS